LQKEGSVEKGNLPGTRAFKNCKGGARSLRLCTCKGEKPLISVRGEGGNKGFKQEVDKGEGMASSIADLSLMEEVQAEDSSVCDSGESSLKTNRDGIGREGTIFERPLVEKRFPDGGGLRHRVRRSQRRHISQTTTELFA